MILDIDLFPSLVVVLLLCIPLTDCLSRPYIGVLSQPTVCASSMPPTFDRYSAIPSSAVKWIEFSGANVVPIPFDWTPSQLDHIFAKINGLYLAGAECPHESLNRQDFKYRETVERFFDWGKKANLRGDYFPIWGTCHGFQTLLMVVARKNVSLLEKDFDTLDVSLPLDFYNSSHLMEDSRIFASMTPQVVRAFRESTVAYNSHRYGISPHVFDSTVSLVDFFKQISGNVDSAGRPFVSTIEAKDFPFFGVQWHPEATVFLDGQFINHTVESVVANQAPSKFFVSECRKNTHSFTSLTEANQFVIGRICPEFVGEKGNHGETLLYFFKESSGDEPNPKQISVLVVSLLGSTVVVITIVLICLILLYVLWRVAWWRKKAERQAEEEERAVHERRFKESQEEGRQWQDFQLEDLNADRVASFSASSDDEDALGYLLTDGEDGF